MLDIWKKDEEIYNKGSSTFLKGYSSHKATKKVRDALPKIEDVILPVKEWQQIERFQTRLISEVPGLISRLKLLIEDTKGRWIIDNHKGVLVLENYYGKGKHLRLGSYHTIEATSDCKYIKELKGKFVPKSIWNGIDILGLEYLADADNDRHDDVSWAPTDVKIALDWCKRAMDKYEIHHTDDMIKEYLTDCGFRPAEMQKYFWPALRLYTEGKEKVKDIPIGHQLVDYHNTKAGQDRVQAKKEEWESDTCHCLVLGTDYFHNDWEGIPEIVFDLANEELLKKKFWKILTFHKNSKAKEKWPKRLIVIEEWLKNLVDKFSKENKIKFDFEPLPYSLPKEPLLNDKKAA